MGDLQSIIPVYEGEQQILAAAQHIVKALGATNNLNDDLRRILSDLDTHLSTMTLLGENEGMKSSEFENRLNCAEEKILNWESNQSMIWDSGPREASVYLQAVDEVRWLTENIGSWSSRENGKQKELLNRARSVLQMAMARLEKELIHILVHNKQSFEPEYMSFRSCREDVMYEESIVSADDESVEETLRRDSSGNMSEVYSIDLVHPDVIPDLKSIANVMFASNYDQEFCQAFITIRKEAMDEYLVILKMENLSVEDVPKLDWTRWNREIKKWIRAMKIIIRVCLMSEKRLCEQVLGDFASSRSICFTETSKASMARLLNFGIAVTMEPHQPEKLSCLLNMYKILADLLPDIGTLFSDEAAASVKTEFHKLLSRLGDSLRATTVEFGNAIASNASTHPFLGGGIHPITKYVMNYINFLTDYSSTLNLLLEKQDGEELDPVVELNNGQDFPSSTFCPVACYFRSVTSILESNLDCKSKLYRDVSVDMEISWTIHKSLHVNLTLWKMLGPAYL